MGYVYLDSTFHNWQESVGTRVINGSYDGDIAMVTLDTYPLITRSNQPYMYTGTASSSDNTNAPVKETWWRSPAVNDQFCTCGYATGQLCSWVVTTALSDVSTAGGLNRNTTTGWRSSCAGGGDSGGSVYTVRTDGGIAAKGVMAQTTAPQGQSCYLLFTDVRRITNAWPGITLKVVP